MVASYLLLVIAGVADAVLAVAFVWFFRVAIAGPLFAKAIEKTLRDGNNSRTAKLCIAAQSSLAGRYCECLLGLELPRRTIRGVSDGFRNAAPAVDFEVMLHEASEHARRHFESKVHRFASAGTAGAIVALGAAVAWIHLYGQWPLEGLDAVDAPSKVALALGLIAIVLGQSTVRSWPRMLNHLRLVEEVVLPLLKPKEEMTGAQCEAAALARKRAVFKVPPEGSYPTPGPRAASPYRDAQRLQARCTETCSTRARPRLRDTRDLAAP